MAEEVRKILKEPETLGGLWEKLSEKASPEIGYQHLQNLDKAWEFLSSEEKNQVVPSLVKTVWISQQGLTIEFLGENTETRKVVTIFGHFYKRVNQSQVFVKKEDPEVLKDPVLLKALVQAELWQSNLDSGEYLPMKKSLKLMVWIRNMFKEGFF